MARRRSVPKARASVFREVAVHNGLKPDDEGVASRDVRLAMYRSVQSKRREKVWE